MFGRSTRAGSLAPALAGLGAMLAALAVSQRASADWKVRRSTADVAAQSARALAATPEAFALATRLVHQAGARGIAGWLERFAARAAAHPEDYEAQLAYAQLLLAARRWPDAAVAFASAAAVAPDAFAPRWGRARAVAGAGDLRASLAELRAALSKARAHADLRLVARELTAAAVAAADVEAEVEGRRAWLHVTPRNPDAVLELAGALGRAGHPLEAAATLAEARNAGRLGSGGGGAEAALAEARHRMAADDLTGAASTLGWARRFAPRVRADLRREIWEQATEVARRRGTLDELAQELAHPTDAVEWAALARIRDEASDLGGAREALSRAVLKRPRDLELRRRQIALERRLGSAGTVADLYEAMAGLALGDPQVVGEVLDELGRLGQTDASARVFDRALRAGRHRAAMLRVLAEAAGRAGDDRRAVAAWTALRHIDPTNDLAVVALGEAELQHGRKLAALNIWRGMLRERGSDAGEGHARFAEVLADHDFIREAVAEARVAVQRAPRNPRHHRLLATILERHAHLVDAEAEWQQVLQLARSPGEAAERREARARLAALWVKQGSAALDRRLRELGDAVRRNGGDQEAVTFLVEAQLRVGRVDAAVSTLRGALAAEDAVDPSARASAATTADLVLLVVRALRQAHRFEEATSWLEELAQRFPGRARDVHLQLADIALAGHRDEASAEHHAAAAAAVAPDDPQVLLRVAAVEERLGRFVEAEQRARQAHAAGRDPAAALALAALLARRGQLDEPRALLRETIAHSRDDEVIAEAGRRAIALEEAAGTLEGLGTFVAALPGSTSEGQAHHQLLLAILGRLVPAAYWDRDSGPAAAGRHRRLAQQGIRPLLDLVSRPDAAPSVEAIELLGMLGRPEAVPALVHLLPAVDSAESGSTTRAAASAGGADLSAAVVVALGRLGVEAARPALEPLVATRERGLRLAVIWALGRLGGDAGVREARRDAVGDRLDAAVVGCLTLGRRGGAEAPALLLPVVRDRARPLLVRRAAALGLALGSHTEATPALFLLLDSDVQADARVAGAALAALAANQGGAREAIVAGLLERALPVRALPGPATIAASRGALERLASGAELRDESFAIRGGRIDPESLVAALVRPAREADRSAWWAAAPERLAAELGTMLAGPPARQAAALRILEQAAATRGPDAGRGPAAPEPAAWEVLARAARPLVQPLLSSSDVETRTLSLSVLSSLDPAAPSPADIARSAADGASAAETARTAASRRAARDPAIAAAVAAELRRLSGATLWHDRLAAVRVATGLPPGPATDDLLLAAAGDPSPFVRAAAADALGRSRSAAARRRLAELARDESAAVRAAAHGAVPVPGRAPAAAEGPGGDAATGAPRVSPAPP